MGWEFDGDEDAFNEYCSQNMPSENYNSYWETEYEYFCSSFLTQLLKSDKLKNEKCLQIHVDKEKENISEIASFVGDVYKICFLNKDGEKIDNLAPYYNAIKRNNIETYESRLLLIQQRKQLMNSEKYSVYLELIRKRKSILNSFNVNDTYLNEDDLFGDMQKKLDNLNSYHNDLILIFVVATAHKMIEYDSENNWSYNYKLIDLPKLTGDISRTSQDNPFSIFKDKMTSQSKSMTYFKELIRRLERVYEYIKLQNKINENNIKITIDGDTIFFTDNKCRIYIELTKNNINNDCFNLKFHEDNIPIFSITLTLDLIPFNYSKYDPIGQKKESQEEKAVQRSDFSYGIMIERGKSLIQRYCNE